MSLRETRSLQMFPTLEPSQIKTAIHFASGPAQEFPPYQTVFEPGQREVPMWLIMKGVMKMMRRDALKNEVPFITLGPGQFTGETNQLTGRKSIGVGNAGEDGCTAIPFDAGHVRALLIGSAEIGEIVMRALILRRAALIEEGGVGSVIIGEMGSREVLRLQDFLRRNDYPYKLFDTNKDEEGYEIVQRLGLQPEELPLVICPNGDILKRPTASEVGTCLGITPELDPKKVYDVAVVGAGPAGLATAVYAASEGLSVLVLDERNFGGQAGASARIENYLGFPNGISGTDLTGRAYHQALKFGVEIAIPVEVSRLNCQEAKKKAGNLLYLTFTNGAVTQARTVVIASGARYRRPNIRNLSAFEGRGISYWASPIEAKLCEGKDAALIGGGNSAGQAIVFLAPKVKCLHVFIRGRNLGASMSHYLVERIGVLTNVILHQDSEVISVDGNETKGLTSATFRNRLSGENDTCSLSHLFIFIGADPNTAWLNGCVDIDAKGFVVTGVNSTANPKENSRTVLPYETNLPGVFAIGDVRAGSVKRLAAATGEGAALVTQIHARLPKFELMI